MRIKKTLFLASFLAVFGPTSAATSSSYLGSCSAWNQGGQLIKSSFCEISVGLSGMSDTHIYQIDLEGFQLELEVSPNRCRANGNPCRFYPNGSTKNIRFISVTGHVFEFTAPTSENF